MNKTEDNWNSDLETLKKAEYACDYAYIRKMYKSHRSDFYIVFLVSRDGKFRLCVPMKMSMPKVNIRIGDAVEMKFGNVFFEDNVKYTDEHGCVHLLDIWEEPTRWLEGKVVK